MDFGSKNKLFGAVVTFLLFLLSSPVHSAVLLDRVVAVVNDEVITWSDLYKMMESEATDRVKKLSEEDRMKIFRKNEAAFLDKLIDLRLQIQEARRIGIRVSPEDIKETIENIKKKYSLNDQTLKESLKKEGLTFADYRKKLSDQILISQLINQHIKSKIVISEAEIRDYMKSHKEGLSDDEAFKFGQIFFKRPVDDSDKKSIEEKASMVVQKLKSGEDFGALAEEYSEDPSGKNGGDLGYVKKSYLDKKFVDVLEKMKPGDVSEPFWTESGLHIVKLEAKPSSMDKAETEANVRKQLMNDEFLEKYKSYVTSLREKAHIEIRL
jgi:peptidyl-prolyl cis-trans isomerase SurA